MSDKISPASLPPHLLDVEIAHRVGALRLDVAFTLREPWTVLFGPSGSGKTTVLRTIAGFLRPDRGSIARAGTVLVDCGTRVFLPAHQRPVRSAGQTARLFPHMSVRQNVLYGSGRTRKPADEFELADRVMELFRIRELAARMPRDLSGGERQRVSVARAVLSAITYPSDGAALLLLDEPFSGLDIALRDELLAGLREWLARWKTPVLSVTHDVGEAFQLDAEVIKIAEGRVVRQGPVNEVLAEERQRLIEQLRGN